MNQITHALTTIFTIPETQVSYNFKNPVSLGMGHGLNLVCGIRKGLFWLVFELESIFPVFLAINVMTLPFQSLPSRRRNWKSSKSFFCVCTILQFRLRWLVRISPVCTSLSNKGDPVTWFLCTFPFKLKGGLILSFNCQFLYWRGFGAAPTSLKRFNSFNSV